MEKEVKEDMLREGKENEPRKEEREKKDLGKKKQYKTIKKNSETMALHWPKKLYHHHDLK